MTVRCLFELICVFGKIEVSIQSCKPSCDLYLFRNMMQIALHWAKQFRHYNLKSIVLNFAQHVLLLYPNWWAEQNLLANIQTWSVKYRWNCNNIFKIHRMRFFRTCHSNVEVYNGLISSHSKSWKGTCQTGTPRQPVNFNSEFLWKSALSALKIIRFYYWALTVTGD